MTRYYQVSGFQIFIACVLVGVIAAALVVINNRVQDYLLLPVVIKTEDGKCAAVENYRNGEAFTCGDVGVILRNFRTRQGE